MAMEVVKLGNFTVQGTLSIYELVNANAPTTVYFALTDANNVLPSTPLCKLQQSSIDEFANTLGQPVTQFAGNFSLAKYRLYVTEVEQAGIIYAHYGALRSGGLIFTALDLVASDKDEYVGSVDFYSLDLPTIYQTYPLEVRHYPLVQQISFDIARYEAGRRVSIETSTATDDYDKLLTHLHLTDNDLLITCKDTKGATASEYLSNMLGIAEASLNIYCKVSMVGLDMADNVDMLYETIIANVDRGDGPMHIVLPKTANTVVAVRVHTEYTIEIQTLGETIVVYNELVLTDEEVAKLNPITVSELSGKCLANFYITDENNLAIAGQELYVGGLVLTTNDAGVASTELYPAEYTYYTTRNGQTLTGILYLYGSKTTKLQFDGSN